jgi:hypothetical protein
VATIAWNSYHFCTSSFDLLHFFPAVKNAFLVIPGSKSAAAAATASLMTFCGIKINPVFYTLVKYPARFIKVAMSKKLFSLSTIMTRIMVDNLYLVEF